MKDKETNIQEIKDKVNQLNIDISAAIEDKMMKNAKRFPEVNSSR